MCTARASRTSRCFTTTSARTARARLGDAIAPRRQQRTGELVFNPKFESLNVGRNQLGDLGLAHLARAFKPAVALNGCWCFIPDVSSPAREHELVFVSSRAARDRGELIPAREPGRILGVLELAHDAAPRERVPRRRRRQGGGVRRRAAANDDSRRADVRLPEHAEGFEPLSDRSRGRRRGPHRRRAAAGVVRRGRDRARVRRGRRPGRGRPRGVRSRAETPRARGAGGGVGFGRWVFNAKMREVHLGGNSIGVAGAQAIARAIAPRRNNLSDKVNTPRRSPCGRSTTALRVLDLRDNAMGREGAEAIAAAIEPVAVDVDAADNSSPESLSGASTPGTFPVMPGVERRAVGVVVAVRLEASGVRLESSRPTRQRGPSEERVDGGSPAAARSRC